jgi:hypothetical protein
MMDEDLESLVESTGARNQQHEATAKTEPPSLNKPHNQTLIARTLLDNDGQKAIVDQASASDMNCQRQQSADACAHPRLKCCHFV